jgi:hypothetical protein
MELQNFHLVEVRYLGATNTRGSRVKMISSRFSTSVTTSYNYEFNNARDIAIDYLKRQGHNVVGSGEVKDNYVIVIAATDNQFKDIK